MTEKLRSGVNGKVREAIQQSVGRILVGVDGTVTLETKPGGLLGVERIDVRLDGEEEGRLIPIFADKKASFCPAYFVSVGLTHHSR